MENIRIMSQKYMYMPTPEVLQHKATVFLVNYLLTVIGAEVERQYIGRISN